MSVVAVFGITVASVGAGVGAYLYLKGGGSDDESTVAETPNEDPRNDADVYLRNENGDIETYDYDESWEPTGAAAVDGESVTGVDDNPSGKTDLDVDDGEESDNEQFFTVDENGDTHVVNTEGEIVSSEVDDNPSGKTDLTNVKGIGPTRAESFREEGFGTPDDLYFATDENLCEVNGIGDLTVSQIREDIGSVDYEQ